MQAPNDQSRIPRWAKIAYLPSVALIALIGYRVGTVWFGHALLILLGFIATWFPKPRARRVMRLALLIVSLTLLLTTAFILYLNTPQQSYAIADSRLLTFLLGGLGAQVVISLIGALLLSLLIVLLPLYTLAVISSEWILALHKVYGVTRGQALRLLLSTFLNTGHPYYVVDNGEITQTKPPGLLPAIGGPGVVVIKPYNAAVFEQVGNVTRIEGPGKIMTKRFEVAREIIDLRKQWISWTAENVLTNDHIPLTFDCGVGFRIEAARDTAAWIKHPIPDHMGGRFTDIISGDYKVYQHTLYRAAYETTTAGWKVTTRAATETQLQTIIREYRLSDLYQLQSGQLVVARSTIDDLAAKTLRRVQAISHAWGVTVAMVKISSFSAPPGITEKLLRMWAEPYERVRAGVEAETLTGVIAARGRADAEAIKSIEEAKLRAREELIETLLKGFMAGQVPPYNPVLIDRLLSALEALSVALTTDTTTTARYIEAIEKMATEAGSKMLIIGEERHRLPPLPDRTAGQ